MDYEEENEIINEDEEVVFEETDAEGLEKGMKDKLSDLREKLSVCSKERQEYLTGWQQARADYVNFKKEQDTTLARVKEQSEERVLRDILTVLDSFDMAMSNQDAWNAVDKNWRMGVEYIYAQAEKILTDRGITPIPTKEGDAFDPMLHDSIELIDTDDEAKADTVVTVLARGFIKGERVIRPAKVNLYTLKK